MVPILLTLPLWAQDKILEEKKTLEKSLEKEMDSLEERRRLVEKDRERIKESRQKLKKLNEVAENREKFQAEISREIHSTLDNWPVHQRPFSKEYKFYKCLKDFLVEEEYINFDFCQQRFSPKLNSQERNQAFSWKEQIGLSGTELERLKKRTEDELQRLERNLILVEDDITLYENRIEYVRSQLSKNEMRLKEKKLLDENSQLVSCDANSKGINLEDEVPYEGASFKGPFYGVPRDNQDGFGTCYANTAKNLLVGLSGGEDIPSFLDMALLYKNSNKTLAESGLDGGVSCETLKQVQEQGYCPQSYAPIETGEKNHLFETLLGNSDSLWAESQTIELIKKFIGGMEKMKSADLALSEEMLGKAHEIIKELQVNPKIKLPLPVARFSIPGEWKLRESWQSLENKKDVTLDGFIKEHDDGHRSFFPEYMKALMAGKSSDEIFQLYTKHMRSFISKYGLESKLPSFKQAWLKDAADDFNDPNLKSSLYESFEFLKKAVGKEGKHNDEVIEYCVDSLQANLEFLGALGPLLEYLNKKKINPELLFDTQGNFLSGPELMQLAVAPACLNSNNRKKISFAFHCENGYETISNIRSSGKTRPEMIKMLRERVALSLIQGYPLGNIHPSISGAGHINTIVGMRFNRETQACEYRIRESQTGTSFWHSEENIFDKISGLTEVRRK